MSIRPRLGARLWTAALVTAIPVSLTGFTQIAPSASTTPVSDARAIPSDAVRSATLAASVQRQDIEPRTTIAGTLALGTEAERNRKIKITSTKGDRVWTASALSEHDVPAAAMRAYKAATRSINADQPGCSLRWTLLAGIGRVESDHGRYGGSTLGNDGLPRPAIVGVALNGIGPVAAIHDTDGGAFDGDTVWDRAVGPMQFIPSTWTGAGRDGDRDGRKSPNDIDDAALAAAGYLCHGGRDLTKVSDRRAGIFSYNPSDYYVDLVSAFARGYETGSFAIPSPEVDASDGDGVVHLRADNDDAAKAKAGTKAKAIAKAKAVAKAKAAAKAKAEARAKAKAKAQAKAKAKAQAKAKAKAKAKKAAAKKKAAAAAARKARLAQQAERDRAEAAKVRTATGAVMKDGSGWTIEGVKVTESDLSAIPEKDWDGDDMVENTAVEFDGLAAEQAQATLSYQNPPFKVVGFSVD